MLIFRHIDAMPPCWMLSLFFRFCDVADFFLFIYCCRHDVYSFHSFFATLLFRFIFAFAFDDILSFAAAFLFFFFFFATLSLMLAYLFAF